jgi:hypothetical protein
MRLPDRVFALLERIVLNQRSLRREEARLAMQRHEQALRRQAEADLAKHRAGGCGPACYFRHP